MSYNLTDEQWQRIEPHFQLRLLVVPLLISAES
jgi:hypothetical protein